MHVLGAKGTEKSAVMSTVCGYLIGSGTKQLVVGALPPCCRLCSCDSLLELAAALEEPTLHQLVYRVRSQPEGFLLFVVDDWDNIFEKQPDNKLQSAIARACMTHPLANGRNRHIWSESDKANASNELDVEITTRC